MGVKAMKRFKKTACETAAKVTKIRYAPYGWLKIPAILVGGIGLLGLLVHNIEAVAAELAFLNIPPKGSCYWIAAGALILLGISICCKHSKEKIALDKGVFGKTDETWRTV